MQMHFDPTVNIANVLIGLGVIAGAVASWFHQEKRVALLEQWAKRKDDDDKRLLDIIDRRTAALEEVSESISSLKESRQSHEGRIGRVEHRLDWHEVHSGAHGGA